MEEETAEILMAMMARLPWARMEIHRHHGVTNLKDPGSSGDDDGYAFRGRKRATMSINKALAMSTWNDVAVTCWHQVYRQSESSYKDWRRSSMTEILAYEKRCLHGRKALVPSTHDAVEASLRHELLSHLPDWLSRKAGVL